MNRNHKELKDTIQEMKAMIIKIEADIEADKINIIRMKAISRMAGKMVNYSKFEKWLKVNCKWFKQGKPAS